MKIYLKQNVYEAALDRIRFNFDEFENVIVSFSGGKDSTVIFNLTMQIAKEKDRLPQKVLFIDQEAEFQATIDYVEYIMTKENVEPLWFQIPIKLFNAASHNDKWLRCWDNKNEENWIRKKNDLSYKNNIFGTDRFKKIFGAIIKKLYPNQKTAYIAGVRTEESPSRFMSLTYWPTYKYITWGRIWSKHNGHYTFYPIYDWSFVDIWKHIHDNNLIYNRIYDYQYQYGLSIKDMRVSNIHHETAVHVLFYLQEIEPDLWEKVCNRLEGIHTAGQLGREQFYNYDLPYMFNGWKEYRDYLLMNLITKDEDRLFIRINLIKLIKYIVVCRVIKQC